MTEEVNAIPQPLEEATGQSTPDAPSAETTSDREVINKPYTERNALKDDTRMDVNADSVAGSVVLPSTSPNKLDDYFDDINNSDAKSESYSESAKLSIGMNYQSRANCNEDNATAKSMVDREFVNGVESSGKTLGIRKVANNAKGTLNAVDAAAAITSRLGIGKVITATLWRSGFSVAISPPTEPEIVSLRYSIAKNEYKLGAETNNLVYSNYRVVIDKLVTDFITSHIIGSSLVLPDGSSYIDYIKTPDLDILAGAMSTAMRPNGHPVTVTCHNSTVYEDSAPVCTYTASATVDVGDMLRVDRRLLTIENLAHITKTSPGSHTVEQVLAYQSSLAPNDGSDVTLTAESGNALTFTLHTPMLREHLDGGNLWVERVIAATQDLFVDDDNAASRNLKVDTMAKTAVLNKYSTHISKIAMDDIVITDSGAIVASLEALSADVKLTNELLAAIAKNIDDTCVALLAIAVYTCPDCKADQIGTDATAFKEFIPVNAVEHFLDLTALKYNQVQART